MEEKFEYLIKRAKETYGEDIPFFFCICQIFKGEKIVNSTGSTKEIGARNLLDLVHDVASVFLISEKDKWDWDNGTIMFKQYIRGDISEINVNFTKENILDLESVGFDRESIVSQFATQILETVFIDMSMRINAYEKAK